MSIADTFNTPWYTAGTTSTAEVPSILPVAISGRAYLVDVRGIKRQSLPIVRQQSDTSGEPGESSLSPYDLWRRSTSDFSFGALQEWYDLPDSDKRRFRISKGIDPWTKGRLKLLPGTTLKRASANTNTRGITVGTYVYHSDGTKVERSTDLAAWTDISIQAGEAAQAVQSITTDGFNVYAALGSNGVHRTDRGVTTSVHYNDLLAQLLGYVRGRLMAAKDNVIYNITASGAAPGALFTHPNTDWRWTGFSESANQIYASGSSGEQSKVYRTTIKPDGTALDIPVVALELPDGEIARSMGSYLGLVFIGTDKGVRMAKPDTNGDLVAGALIPTTSAVECFEGQDRFVWFGQTNYDSTSTGLGRMDLLHLTEGIAPAFATDLMATVQGAVLSVFTLAGKRGFTVSGSGLHYEDTNLVASGELRTGKVTYALTGSKVWKFLVLTTESVPAGAVIDRQLDVDGVLTAVSSNMTLSGNRLDYDARSAVGEAAEAIITLKRGTVATTGPVLNRWTLRSLPIAPRGEQIELPLLLKESILERTGRERPINPQTEFNALKSMEKAGLPTTIQIAEESFEGFLDAVSWGADLSFTSDGDSLQGTCTILIRRFD